MFMPQLLSRILPQYLLCLKVNLASRTYYSSPDTLMHGEQQHTDTSPNMSLQSTLYSNCLSCMSERLSCVFNVGYERYLYLSMKLFTKLDKKLHSSGAYHVQDVLCQDNLSCPIHLLANTIRQNKNLNYKINEQDGPRDRRRRPSPSRSFCRTFAALAKGRISLAYH